MDLNKMNAVQVSSYAREKGIDVSGCKTKQEKIDAINRVEVDSKEPEFVTATVMDVTVTLDKDVFDDFDIIDLMAEMQDGNAFALTRLIKAVFGDDFARIREELSDKDGKLTVSKASEFFVAVMEGFQAKN